MLFLSNLLSCAGPGPGPGDGPSELTPVESASCLPTSHPLRFSCTATLVEPGPVTLTVTGPNVARTFVDSAVALEHTILAWGLPPDTTLSTMFGDAAGTLTTGALPDDLLTATIEVEGDAFGFDAVLVPLACEETWLVMIDPTGRIVWYQPSPGFLSWHDGYAWSAADRSLLTIGDGAFVEVHVSGEELLRLIEGVDYEQPLHHDVGRWNGLTYLLFEEHIGSTIVDGLYVFEGRLRHGTFSLADPFVVDAVVGHWSHANGARPNAAGQVALTVSELDSVVLVDGDPLSPGFLEVEWVAVGSASGLPDPDYAPPGDVKGEGFAHPHDASVDGSTVWLLDNTSGLVSRALRLTLDDAAGTIAIDAEWPLDALCPVQGGAQPVQGGVLVTCATTADVFLFVDDDAVEHVWSLRYGCTSPIDVLTHAIPVHIE